MIKKLNKNQIFVFGSNLNGAHGAGAAKQALKWGAVMGHVEGLKGKTYAFPTLNKKMNRVSTKELEASVKRFFKCAVKNPDLTFLMTPVGTGIAGFSHQEMKPFFKDAPANIVLPDEWKGDYLWKFMRTGLKSESGDHTWRVGDWYEVEGALSICNNGFHASRGPLEALGYVKGEVVAKVEVRGKSEIQSDKECWSEMRVVKAWEWTKEDSVTFSIFASEQVLINYEKVYPNDKRPREAIEAAKKWLKNPTDANASAARSAADSAADSAARSARSATRSALRGTLNDWMIKRIEGKKSL